MPSYKRPGSRIKVSRKYCDYCDQTFILVFDEEMGDELVKPLVAWVDFVDSHRIHCRDDFYRSMRRVR